MRYGSTDGQALFPLVILAVKENDAAASDFEKERSSVPLNMFLPWINQLVSHAPAMEKLLVDLAGSYPTHLRPPLEISLATTTHRDESHQLDRLKSKLPPDSAWQTFLKCVEYLQPPELVAKEFLASKSKYFITLILKNNNYL